MAKLKLFKNKDKDKERREALENADNFFSQLLQASASQRFGKTWGLMLPDASRRR